MFRISTLNTQVQAPPYPREAPQEVLDNLRPRLDRFHAFLPYLTPAAHPGRTSAGFQALTLLSV